MPPERESDCDWLKTAHRSHFPTARDLKSSTPRTRWRKTHSLTIGWLHWRGWRILFTSDAGMGTELKMLDAGTDVAADLIIAGRHRGDLTLCDRFLNAVNPRAIIASNNAFPIEERLPQNTVEYWKSRGIQVLDQAESGGVTVRIDGEGHLHLDGFLSTTPIVLKRR
jgi:competence protein ComEC